MTRAWMALVLFGALLAPGCGGEADSCNSVIDDAAHMLIEAREAFDADREDVSFSEDDIRAIPDRMEALGCDPQAVSVEAMTDFAADNGLDEDQQGVFMYLLFGLLDGSFGE